MQRKKRKYAILSLISILIITAVSNCVKNEEEQKKMDYVAGIMEQYPDSALMIIESINDTKLTGKEEKARYALLKSMALDKNYIDTTSFDILQPAIDYYLHSGSSDEKLRTLYYQGRIYQNRGDFDLAMKAYLKGEDLKRHITDTLVYAHLLVAEGSLYHQSYQMANFISNNLEAAELYNSIDKKKYGNLSILKALDGCIANNDRQRSDSILKIAETLVGNDYGRQQQLEPMKLMYAIRFGQEEELDSILRSYDNLYGMDDEIKLDMVIGYLKLNKPEMAKSLFESISPDGEVAKSVKYLSIRPDIEEASGNYMDALQHYKEYALVNEHEISDIYMQKTSIAEKRHAMELKNAYTLKQKDRIIWISESIIFLLVFAVLIIYYSLRIGKAKRVISEKEKKRLLLENDNLQKENQLLILSNKNTELEKQRQILESENLRLHISRLEEESEYLKEIISRKNLSKPMAEAIKERIEILNSLVAAQISENDSYSKPYDKWIKEINEDKNRFLESTRLTFKAFYPDFMEYLEKHGLNDNEINYACLYALGLRGKEIGAYVNAKRHYHISSDIRKKLNMGEQDTNLGIHIRNLIKKNK